jgi:hypothetical protein
MTGHTRSTKFVLAYEMTRTINQCDKQIEGARP